ncbi:hypothetical protein KDW_57510 [Dictyobacter vulcani]|uniref:JAB1/MPN/MOV34 metalloenzyme domain-containing protein n=1 Tax=Dictyobacter vulcani TaxID=2607529 RepID=A0A5J4KZU1_9CHLR|nr:Mov34/MPN/PAD-1 family protein [Dictyobacter vulcani]GER91589.1 hypothetical protein KDW_57510 [Dictyobacter vulcani]
MRQHAIPYLALEKTAQEALLEDVSQRAEIEACGVLLGRMDTDGNWLVEQAQPLQNTAGSPVYFEFEPGELLETEMLHSGEVIGVYHSHPTGFPRASQTDRDNMQRVNQEQQIPWVWLIISGPFDAAFLQRARGSLEAAPLIAYHHFDREGLKNIPIHLS